MFDPTGDLTAAVRSLGDESLDVADVVLSQRMIDLLAAGERLQAEVIRTCAAWDGRRAWAADGALDPRAWLTHHTPASKHDASSLVRNARLVRKHERTAKALAAGDVSVAHVDVLAQAAANGRDKLYAEHEDALVDAAMTNDAGRFRLVARRWTELADDELGRLDALSAFERRHLHVSSTFRGMGVLNGLLDREATAVVKDAIKAYDHPDKVGGPVAPRTLSQRQADAMMEICKVALWAKGERGPVVSAVDVVIDIETLSGELPADMTRARCDIVGVGPVARATIERLLCDCALRRVIVNAKSEVLDVGQNAYRPSRAQRRALKRMHTQCAFPGCDRSLDWCDIHHLVPYPLGPTDLDNLVPLCRRHHVTVHEAGWSLRRDQVSGELVAQPP
jgi:hypothetical protein